MYGGDFDEVVHDGNFVIDGLVAADRIPRAQLADLAAVFAPLVLRIDVEAGVLQVRSRLDFSTSERCELNWHASDPHGELASGSIDHDPVLPRATASVPLPSELLAYLNQPGVVVSVEAREVHDTSWAQRGWVVARTTGIPRRLLPSASAADSLTLDDLTIDATSGAVLAIGPQAIGDWHLELWRAPTDNDRERDWTQATQPSYADRWTSLGLDRLVSRLVRIDRSDERITVTTRVAAASLDHAVDCIFTWTPSDGGLHLALDVTPVGEWMPEWSAHWARVGVSFTLPDFSESEDFSWFGRGPGPAYPDTGQAAHWGWYTATIAELQERTVRPQESGARADVRWANLGDRLELSAEAGVSLTARPWSAQYLAATTHDHLLRSDGALHVNVDFAVSGVGTAACGPGVLPEYRLLAQPVSGSVLFSIVSRQPRT